VNLYPDYGEAYALLGDNFYLQESNTEALNWYRKAYDKGINTAEVLNLLGYLYDKQSNTTESVRFYKEALQQDSTLVDIYDRLAFLESGQAQKYQQLAEKWRK
jgi:tetratricopeptide (TPR) repeat protein